MSLTSHSWSRRQRERRSDSIITVEAEGEGLLCFGADGSWFQGQLEASDERDFDLTGTLVSERRQKPASTLGVASPQRRRSAEFCSEHILLEEGPADDSSDSGRPDSPLADDLEHPATGHVTPGHVTPAITVSATETPDSSPGSVISPSAFEAAVRAFSAVAPGAPVAYDVSIVDHEEGSQHRVRYVPGWSGDDTCSLGCKEVQFTAEKRYRGQKADMIIQRRLGRSLLGRGCVVYTGKMRIQYQYDYKRQPTWCL